MPTPITVGSLHNPLLETSDHGLDATKTLATERTGNVGDMALDLSCSLGAFPASSLRNSVVDQSRKTLDLISNSLITLKQADIRFKFYQDNLNSHLHYIITEQDSLARIRTRSPFLASAICATATYCSDSMDYQICSQSYLDHVSSKLFSEVHTFDDVRALCIGAFWLYDKSYALNSLGKPRIQSL
jgi:hypothetical protein